MAETTEFNHDQLGHILADHLVEVPEFQRSYSWERLNVQEYLSDLSRARDKKSPYFMGTLVFAKPSDGTDRRKIVDGQQRLATTAILFVAIRDRLAEFDRTELAENTTKKFLRRFSIREEGEVDSLILSPRDQDAYDAITSGRLNGVASTDKILACYKECRAHVDALAPDAKRYKKLVDLIDQLERNVQVLVAVASDLPEAYVIFETLNDRGADLTTADLLKNYLFSEAKKSEFTYVQHGWNGLETGLGNKSDELVKFVRFDFISRNGTITTRKLYRALQDELQATPGAKQYVQRLKQSQEVYLALREPDSDYWRDAKSDVRDALLAYRRFGFESSYPVLLAAFREWDKKRATRLLVKLAKWTVRAQFVGRLGTGTAEEAFAAAAEAITARTAKNQTEVRKLLERLVPSDGEFKIAFASAGRLTTARAKYVLAMLEKAADAKAGRPERPLDWASTAVTIEHILPQSYSSSSEALAVSVNAIGNLALLEKRLNHRLGNAPFARKRGVYGSSEFGLTRIVADNAKWNVEQIGTRTDELAKLACLAWPST
jgi:hypothetical protein